MAREELREDSPESSDIKKPGDTEKPAEGPRSVKTRASGGAEGEESPSGKRQDCLCRR